MQNWKTTLFGALTGISFISNIFANAGIHIGHWGGSDFTQVAGGISALLLGLYAKDHNVTGGNRQQ